MPRPTVASVEPSSLSIDGYGRSTMGIYDATSLLEITARHPTLIPVGFLTARFGNKTVRTESVVVISRTYVRMYVDSTYCNSTDRKLHADYSTPPKLIFVGRHTRPLGSTHSLDRFQTAC